MSDAAKAVFLSYAREDAGAARRLAEALHAGGIEVWFDQSELVGGDAWDQKIRGQIKACALFVPIVSASTQARREGYFRLEWKLAAQRTQTIADGTPFLLPVVIDATSDSDALVPEEFRSVQWTRLAHGEPTPAFISHVANLLTGPTVRSATVAPASSAPHNIPARESAFPRWVTVAVLGALVLGLFAYIALQPNTGNAAAGISKKPIPKAEPASKTPTADDKSIAVLPFANMSDDKDANAFFADGIHEDILTNLSNIRELRVVSRTSVMQYRGTTKPIPQIARELGVTYVLEGSVRRAGGKVRVTGQLIRAAMDQRLWAKPYDRDLTDVFSIQSELAQAIASELKAVLSPEEKRLVDERPTQNIAAYELVLKARQQRDQEDFFGALEQRERYLLAAIGLDPNYAAAFAELATYYVGDGQYAARGKDRAKARQMLERAVQLAPTSPDVIRAQGDFCYYGEYDFTGALEHYGKLGVLRPNDPAYLNRVASIQRRQGRYRESLANFRRLEQLDPANSRNVRDIAVLLTAGRRFEEATEQARRSLESSGGRIRRAFELAWVPFVASGSTREMQAFFGRLSPDQLNSPEGLELRLEWALARGDVEEAVQLDRGAKPGSGPAVHMAAALASRGDRQGARDRLGAFAADLRARMATVDPVSRVGLYGWADVAAAEALLGNAEEALRCAKRALEITPESRDSLVGASLRANLAFVYTWIGDKDAALGELAYALRTPFGNLVHGSGSYSDLTIHTLKTDPRFAPLRGDPRFEALLNDPKNNQPLF